jgi:hypothetical protein
MGSDIFLWVERQLPSGEWSIARRRDENKPEWLRDGSMRAEFGAVGFPRDTWEVGKNYNLFAIIADHRNDRGSLRFTEQVISPPRGFPEDVSDELLADATRMFGELGDREQRLDALLGDAVAPSWVTVEELLAVDWDAATHGEGVIGEAGDFLTMLQYEIVPIGPPDQVRLVFYFDS